jgi:adenylate cyclase
MQQLDTCRGSPVRWLSCLPPPNERLRLVEQRGLIYATSCAQLKRFFSPHVAEAIISVGEQSIIAAYRREISYVFIDLRGFTAFTDAADPEEVGAVLHDYHAAMGGIATEHDATVNRFAGDGILIFFNDPLSVPDPGKRAATMALAMQESFAPLRERWSQLGYNLDLGIGIAAIGGACPEIR